VKLQWTFLDGVSLIAAIGVLVHVVASHSARPHEGLTLFDRVFLADMARQTADARELEHAAPAGSRSRALTAKLLALDAAGRDPAAAVNG